MDGGGKIQLKTMSPMDNTITSVLLDRVGGVITAHLVHIMMPNVQDVNETGLVNLGARAVQLEKVWLCLDLRSSCLVRAISSVVAILRPPRRLYNALTNVCQNMMLIMYVFMLIIVLMAQ